jgi:hypothetical protein
MGGAVNNKARYISVAVTTEGEHSRAIPGSPPSPPNLGVVWFASNSCKLFPFALTATGNTAPLQAFTAVNPPTTDTLADVDIDRAGNQYAFRFLIDRSGPTEIGWAISVIAAGATGDPVAVLREITGVATRMNYNDLFGNNLFGGITLDDIQQNIYVANQTSILKFPITGNGNIAPSQIVTTQPAGILFTSIYFDSPRQLLWVGLGAGDGPGIYAFNLSGSLVRNISCSAFWTSQLSIDRVCVDNNGLIYGISNQEFLDNDTHGEVIYVFSSGANGDSVPLRRIQLSGTGHTTSSQGSMSLDTVGGNIYFAYSAPPPSIYDPDSSTHLASIPITSDGVLTSANWLTELNGTNTLMDFSPLSGGIADTSNPQAVRVHNP